MKFIFPYLAAGLMVSLGEWSLISPAYGGGGVTWPTVHPADGENSAATASPRIEWLDQFQKRLDAAHRMPAIDLIFDGDSITDRWSLIAGDLWNQRYAKLNAFDFGISGDRTQNLLFRIRNGQLDGLHPRLIVLLIGVNNVGGDDYTAEQIADAIKTIVQEYQQRCPDAAILLQGVLPWGDSPLLAKIKRLNGLIALLADGKKILFVDFSDKFLRADASVDRDLLADGLHPSEKGYQIWADAIQPVIDQFFPPAGK